MAEDGGISDPKRTLELLWGRSSVRTRGPKARLDTASIVAAGIEVADGAGLEAVSMRSVAKHLDVSAMSLYTYVPGKVELLDLMHDAVLGEMPDDYSGNDNWRSAMEAFVADQWALLERHTWMMQLSTTRSSLGPNSFRIFETQVRILDGIGLSGTQMTRLASAIHTFVLGSCRAVTDVRAVASETGVSDEEWWAAHAPLLETLVVEENWAERFPTLMRLEGERTFEQLDRTEDDHTSYLEREALNAFDAGLTCLLDGIEALAPGKRRRQRKQ